MDYQGKKIRIGIVGLGKMGILHTAILSTMPSVEVIALCDKSSIMRRFAKKTLKKIIVTDKVAAMASLNLDAVYITTPIPSHYKIVKEVFGSVVRNIFVEKTLSSSYNQAQDLCLLAKDIKSCNMVGYMKRFSVSFEKAKELLNSNSIGSLVSFDAYAYSSDFFSVQNDNASIARGGVLEDLGSHVVDLALWFFEDSFYQVKIRSSTPPHADTVNFEAEGLNDFIGKFSISWVQKGYHMPEFGLTINGTKGRITATDNSVVLSLNGESPKAFYRQDLDDHVGFYLGDSEYFREDEHFISSIIGKTTPRSSFETAKKVDYLLDQVRMKSQ